MLWNCSPPMLFHKKCNNHMIVWAGRDPEGSSTPALKWMAHAKYPSGAGDLPYNLGAMQWPQHRQAACQKLVARLRGGALGSTKASDSPTFWAVQTVHMPSSTWKRSCHEKPEIGKKLYWLNHSPKIQSSISLGPLVKCASSICKPLIAKGQASSFTYRRQEGENL